MLQAVVNEIWKTFRYDSIGIGIINYRTRQLEIRAEAGVAFKEGARLTAAVPLETGIVGQVARSGELVLVHDTRSAQDATPLDSRSRSVLAIPIRYSGQTMGVLNIESREPRAFMPEQVLVMQTLADQLAVAFNNSLTFQQMQQQAITDSLTGLKTRRFFMEALNSELSRARRSGESFSVLVVDMNGFKQINDTLGHLEGDLVLVRVARILEHRSRASSVVARYGGDEFTILIPGATMEQGRAVARRLQMAIEQDPLLAERNVSASLGVGSFPDSGATRKTFCAPQIRACTAPKRAPAAVPLHGASVAFQRRSCCRSMRWPGRLTRIASRTASTACGFPPTLGGLPAASNFRPTCRSGWRSPAVCMTSAKRSLAPSCSGADC
jgi:diguanylate cyclase (GGDEF)-like protein